MRSTHRHLAIVALSAAALVGCGGYNSMFPRREDIFKPIPVDLGDVSVQGGDTSYVLGGRGYRLVVKDRELLPDAKTTLDRIGASWRQYFAADPAVLTVVLRTPPAKGAKPAGSDSARLAPAAGTLVLQTGRRYDEDDPREAMNARMLEGRIAVPVARAWLASLANGGTPPAPDTSAAARRMRWTPTDPRVPDWIESAVPQLIAGASDADFVAGEVARQRDRLLPLRTLLTASRPPLPADSGRRGDDEGRLDSRGGRGGRGAARGGRNAPTLEGVRLFDAEAVTFAEFLADREGRSFVGRVVAATMGAGSIETALREATSLPQDIDSLDKAWRTWLEDRAANLPDRMGR